MDFIMYTQIILMGELEICSEVRGIRKCLMHSTILKTKHNTRDNAYLCHILFMSVRKANV